MTTPTPQTLKQRFEEADLKDWITDCHRELSPELVLSFIETETSRAIAEREAELHRKIEGMKRWTSKEFLQKLSPDAKVRIHQRDLGYNLALKELKILLPHKGEDKNDTK